MIRKAMLVTVFILASISFASAETGWNGDGDGTSSNPFLITNVTQLQEIQNFPSSFFEINNSFDASVTSTWNGGAGFIPINPFTGTLDGNGYSINDLTINSGSQYTGLFSTTDGATIKDLSLDNVDITSTSLHTGALVGVASDTTIVNCNVTGNVTGAISNTGGMVGIANLGTAISNCNANVIVQGVDNTGGLVGYLVSSSITECSSGGTVSGTGDRTGGLVGYQIETSSITSSFSDADTDGLSYTGGLVGYVNGNVFIGPVSMLVDVYASGDVDGTYNVGGLIGRLTNGDLTNAYAVGSVSGPSNVGGLIGVSISSTTTSSYYDTETTGQTTSASGTGKTTAEMYKKSTYSGWDFVDTWQLEGYPILQFEGLDYSINPTIVSPLNGTTVNTTYPPLATDITFQWSEHSGVSSYSYSIARDENYNTVVTSGTVTTAQKTIALEADDYWFKVRYLYDTGSYSEWVESQFTLSASTSDYGTALQGTVYYTSSGSQIALSNAKVTVYNDTNSFDYVTSDNGFYLFDSNQLVAGSYAVIASKDGYETSSYNLVILTDGITTTKNIILEPDTAPNYISPHYVRLVPMYLWIITYDDLTVTIYEGDSATALFSEVTGDDGAVGYQLSETTKYRITVVNTEREIDDTFYITPTDEEYILPIGMGVDKYAEEDIIGDIDYSITKSRINLSSGYINISYNDPSNTFTYASVLITDNDNYTIYSSSSIASSDSFSTSVNASNTTYIATLTIFNSGITDNFQKTTVIDFIDVIQDEFDMGWENEWNYQVFAIVTLILLGTIAGAVHAPVIALLQGAMFLIYLYIGYIPIRLDIVFMGVLAIVISFMAAMRKGEEGMR